MGREDTVARCTVVMTKPGSKRQRAQVRILSGEVKDDVELYEPYGYTAIPLSGAGGLALFLGGDRSHAVVIAPSDTRYRPTDLKEGETAIFTHEGAFIKLRQGRIIEVECDEFRIKTKRHVIEADELEVAVAGVTAIKTGAFNLDSVQTAESSGPLKAPDVLVGDVSMADHVHEEHDGPKTKKPQAGGG